MLYVCGTCAHTFMYVCTRVHVPHTCIRTCNSIRHLLLITHLVHVSCCFVVFGVCVCCFRMLYILQFTVYSLQLYYMYVYVKVKWWSDVLSVNVLRVTFYLLVLFNLWSLGYIHDILRGTLRHTYMLQLYLHVHERYHLLMLRVLSYMYVSTCHVPQVLYYSSTFSPLPVFATPMPNPSPNISSNM